MTASSISVVVPTHERRAGLPELLDGLVEQEAQEIVVVVSASRDGSLELLQERAADDPRLIPVFVEEPGESVARQAGVERASGDIVLLLDDDVIPTPGLAAGHLSRHDGERLLVLGYMPVAHSSGPRRPGEYPADLYSRNYEYTAAAYERDPDTILTALWAGNMSLRRSDCLEVGLVSPADRNDYRYHADREFGLRCRKAGLRGVFDRELLAHHRYERTPDAYLRDCRRGGQGKEQLHRVYRDTLGPLDPEQFAAGTPAPGSWLIHAARRKPARGAVRVLLNAVIAVSGRLRLFKVESFAGHVLGAIEEQGAALSQAAGR